MRKLKFKDMLEDYLESNSDELYNAFQILHTYEYVTDKDWAKFHRVADNIYRAKDTWYNYSNNKPVFKEDENGKFVKVGRVSYKF